MVCKKQIDEMLEKASKIRTKLQKTLSSEELDMLEKSMQYDNVIELIEEHDLELMVYHYLKENLEN